MVQFYVCLLLWLSSLHHTSCQTKFPDTYDDVIVLSIDQSPYVSADDVTIRAGQRLMVGRGVTVKFAPGRGLDIQGQLLVNGRENERVVFTVWEDYKDTRLRGGSTRRDGSNLSMKLVNGAREDTGTLLVKQNNDSWAGVCDVRLANLESEALWEKQLVKYVCGELGFVHSPAAHLMPGALKDVDVSEKRLVCSDDSNCDVQCCWSCESVDHVIGVDCASVARGQHWSGLRFYGNSHMSSLIYLDITRAGVKGMVSPRLVPALYSEGTVPITEGVLVSRSAHHGIQYQGLFSKQTVTGLELTRNRQHGLHLSSYADEVVLQNVVANENHMSGVYIERLNPPHIEGSDFCSMACVRCFHEAREFPLFLRWGKPAQLSNNTCQTTFTTTAGHVIAFRVLESTPNVHISLRDGAYIDSPFVWRAEVEIDQWPNPPPVIVTETNSLSVSITTTQQWTDEYIGFVLLSGLPGSHGIKVRNVQTMYNKEDGIVIKGVQMPVEMSVVTTSTNRNGISIQSVSSDVSLFEVDASSNSEAGLFVNDSDGRITISSSHFNRNGQNGLKYVYDRMCSHESVAERYAMHMLVQGTSFQNNSLNGLSFDSKCRYNVSLSSNTFRFNLERAIYMKHSYKINNILHKIQMAYNTIERNKEGVYLEGEGALVLRVNNNVFDRNRNTAFWLEVPGVFTSDRLIDVEITNNKFTENVVEDGSVLGINVEFDGNYELVNTFVITDNKFIDNEIGEPPRTYINSLKDLSAVVYLAVKNSANLQSNVLTNPKCHLEVAINDQLQEGKVDLRYSFWDTNDINAIAERVFDYHQSYLLSKALLHPYLNSKSAQDYNLDLPNHPDFQREHVVGGLLFNDHILSDTSEDYIVSKDIIVDYDSTLSISAGVTLRFQLGVGILVYGRLIVDGTSSEPVSLTADQYGPNQCVKLAGGSVPWEGIVQVQLETKEAQWFTLCEHSNYTLDALTLNFLCHAAGFQDAKSFTFLENEYNDSTSVGPMHCNTKRLDSCTAKTPHQCTSDLVLSLECIPNYWSGIHLSVHAKSSQIQHAHFSRTGFNGFGKASKAAMQIDFNHHRIEHVTINETYDDSYVHGIIVQKHNPIINHPFKFLTITKERGSAITSYDSRTSILNSEFTNIGQSYSPGVYIGSFMPEYIRYNNSRVHPICNIQQYKLKVHEHAFVTVQDIAVLQFSSCGLLVTAPRGHRVAIQVLSGVVNTMDDCGPKSLLFHDGADDTAKAYGVRPSSDGYVWIASRHVAYIVMHRVYHFQLQCLDLIIAISSVKGEPQMSKGLFLSDISVSGFDEGIRLHELALPASLVNISSVGAHHYGIHVYDCSSVMSLNHSSISSSGESGFLLRYYNGNVSVVSTSFVGTKSRGAIWIWHGYHPQEKLHLQVLKCTFENNHRGIEFSKLDDRHRRFPNAWSSDITDNVFVNNTECVDVFLGSENHFGSHHLKFFKNVLRHNFKGVVFISDKYKELFTWNISSNLLFNCSNGALHVKGSGFVENNVISNSESPGESVVRIESVSDQLSFTNNKIVLSSNAEYAVYIFHTSYNVLFAGNSFSENTINHAVVYIHSWMSNRFDIYPNFVENQLNSNTPTDTCRDTGAFVITGFRKYEVHRNIFDNPRLSYEVMSALPSSNGSSYLDMTLNYWGLNATQDVLARIDDGSKGKHANVKCIPFYKDSTLKTFIIGNPVSRNLDQGPLSGYISSDLTLSTSKSVYDIEGNLEIPPEVTLVVPAGTTLQLQPDASVQVFGSLLLLGELYRPVVVTRVKYKPVSDCFPSLRLSGRPTENEGSLEILQNGTWAPMCSQGWTFKNAKVICRHLGFGKPMSYYYSRPPWGTLPSQRMFQCEGTETSLRDCPYTPAADVCDTADIVGIVCSLNLPKPSFLFGSDQWQQKSVLHNVYFGNISGIHVTGAPPVVENITVWDSDSGITYIGQGIANEKDVLIKNVEVVRSGGSGISLYDITSNVTIDHVIIRKVSQHGIYFSPSFDNKRLYARNVKSSFHFCDSDPVMFIEPGEKYKMYGEDAHQEAGCRRVFRTRAGFSISLEMKAEASEYDWVSVAGIYDGEAVDEKKMLAQFNTITEERGTQEIETQSLGPAMTVWVYGAESDINYASVASVLARDKDCTFERGDCGWHNVKDLYSVERGHWFVYRCSTLFYKPFKGMERDINFPSGTDGHYMVVGEASSQCNYNDARFRRSETAILESPLITKDSNLCSVSFHHYRSIAHYYREEHLTLYMKTYEGLSLLWRHTSYNNYSRWIEAHVDIPHTNVSTFSLVFYTEFMKDCPNSVGIDDIMFHRCPQEKLVSTIRIVDSSLENVPGIPIHIWNNDPEKHNIVWIERVAVLNSARETEADSGTVKLNLKSGYVLVRNTDITRAGATGIKVTFDSHTKERISEVTLSQNSIQRGFAGATVSVENIGVNNAAVWLNGNNIIHNSATEENSVITVNNMTLEMNSNLVYNNSGKFILDLNGNPTSIDQQPQTVENNTFWYNSALELSEEYTVFANVSNVKLKYNVFNNPSNKYDISLGPGAESDPSQIEAMKNWWGSGQMSVASRRLRDGRSMEELPMIPHLPILELPPSHLGLSSSCPLGWHLRGSYCYLYNVGAMTYHQAQAACLLQGSMLMFNDSMDIALAQELTRYRDVDGTSKYSKLWIDTNSNGLSSQNGQCNTLEFTEESYEIRGTTGCTLTNPFMCQKVAIVPCKNGCSQHGQCVGSQCLCDKGWEGEDCSIFHCRDVSNCTKQGECMGANQCRCTPGWMGRACSVSYCSRFQTCSVCSRRTGCGWCDTSQECQPGTGEGSTVGACKAWFYYKCMTLEYSTTCSGQINKLECKTRYCNQENQDTNLGLCQECMDIESCYTKGYDKCYTWDDHMCPFGAPRTNYTNVKRIYQSVVKNNVKVFQQDKTLIYICPFRMSSHSVGKRSILLTTEKLGIKKDDVIISAQSYGIMHKLELIQNLDGIQLMVAQPVGFRDFIQYADFSKSGSMHEFMHPLVPEHKPDPLLFSNLTRTNCTTDVTVHALPKSTTVYKCVGHVYDGEEGNEEDDNNDKEVRSYYLVVRSSDLPGNLALGDAIASHTNGRLETVLRVKETHIGRVYETSLTQCSGSVMEDFHIDDVYHKPDLYCYGGNGFPGVLMYSNNTDDPTADHIGRIVAGRTSLDVIAKIIGIEKKGDYRFLEVIDVYYNDNGHLVTDSDPSVLLKAKRRGKRSIVDEELSSGSIYVSKESLEVKSSTEIKDSFSQTLNYQVGPESAFSLRVAASMALTFEPKLQAEWDWDRLDTDWETGAQFSGDLDVGVNMDMVFNGTYSVSGGPYVLYRKSLLPFYIDIGEPVTPVTGQAEFTVELAWKLATNGEGSMSCYGDASGHVEVGTTTGALPKPDNKATGQSTGRILVNLNSGDVSFVATVTPRMVVTWPAVQTTFAPNKDVLPPSVSQWLDSAPPPEDEAEQTRPYMESMFSAPFSLQPFAKGCAEDCPDPQKPLHKGVTAGVDLLRVDVFALDDYLNAAFSEPTLKSSQSSCSSQSFPCCLCNETGEPGIWQPHTQQCLCQCCCDSETGSIRSAQCEVPGLMQSPDGSCLCDLCPDGSLSRPWANSSCPCTCLDGSTRQMLDDGSCDCSCQCEDGTVQQIDDSGHCPCHCQCHNCQTSTLGPEGCHCPHDRCPVCETGAEPQWINCECKCPEPECGIPPNCVHGRRGNNCQQPDCSRCRQCFGNGVCNGGPGPCAAYCSCSAMWEGECCERRRPRRAFGDPHIETLDGQWFDYFGIGQFWDCKSEALDFGIQVRYFYFSQTSFTGAIALKVGESVLTVTTSANATAKHPPNVRLDGRLLSVADIQQLVLYDSVILDAQPQYEGEDSGHAVLLLSLEYKSGVSVTIDVRYSPVILRQFVNVVYTLTKDFQHQTSGLCGLMDDDPEDDLQGPDGTLYTDKDQFVESWRIPAMSRPGGGTLYSWSWNSSNFHTDDVLDVTYTDPNYKPSYSISGFTQAQIDKATEACSALGIQGDVKDGCIFDVVITNDTSMAQQETLILGCPLQCSGKGRCDPVSHTCSCLAGWYGEDCSVGTCGSCVYGECKAGFCQCTDGWDGRECDTPASCPQVNECTDSSHGTCVKNNKCRCVEGYTGADCSILATCLNVHNCSDHGVCVDMDTCRCEAGWMGASCNQVSCEALSFCSQHGLCVAHDVCVCTQGWKGASCVLPDCSAINHCSDHGDCVGPNNCSCLEGYYGDSCKLEVTCEQLDNCNNNGICVPDGDNGLKCRCLSGFSGSSCKTAQCPLLHGCSGHGTCTEPNVCDCFLGYGGPNCSQLTCQRMDRCSGHGHCVSFDQCQCEAGWSGDKCDMADCSTVQHCSYQGLCIKPNVCHCFDGYQGETCSEEARLNEYPPEFEKPLYSVNISEASSVPLHLLQVQATDRDNGTNGEVYYTFYSEQIAINLNQFLSIDSVSGDIRLIRPISTVFVPTGQLEVYIIATDKGAPSRSSSTLLVLMIEEVNDHCPVIIRPHANQVVFLDSEAPLNTTVIKVLATDDDLGEHGELEYMSKTETGEKYFKIIKSEGILYLAASGVPVGEFPITITVRDKGPNPCAIQTTFLVQVVQREFIPTTPITTTSLPTTTEADVQAYSVSSHLVYIEIKPVTQRRQRMLNLKTELPPTEVLAAAESPTSPFQPYALSEVNNKTVIIVSVILSLVILAAIIVIVLLVLKMKNMHMKINRERTL